MGLRRRFRGRFLPCYTKALREEGGTHNENSVFGGAQGFLVSLACDFGV